MVDDDVRLRELLQRFLSANGYRVTTASDAADARALTKSMAFDLFIVDVMMPGENGIELTRSIRSQTQTPILMLTALGEAEDRIAGLEQGADDYLAKPSSRGTRAARRCFVAACGTAKANGTWRREDGRCRVRPAARAASPQRQAREAHQL
ncbi:MAG: response regulator [Rhizomicrobium sp.]